MRAAGAELHAQGIVRVMHPDKGMGVEFTQSTRENRAAVEMFLGVLTENRSLLPELFVQPEGLETASILKKPIPPDLEDPLLQLFYSQEPLAAEEFHDALRKQRAIPPAPADAGAAAQA